MPVRNDYVRHLSARHRNGWTSTEILPEFSAPITKGELVAFLHSSRLPRAAPTPSNKSFIPDFQLTLSYNVSSLDSRDLAAHSHSLTASEAKIPLICNLFWWRSKIAIWRRNKRSENSLIHSESTLRERGLNKIRSSRLVEYAMALLLLSAVIAASATAKHKLEKVANSVTVVAHLPLPGAPVSQLLMQEHEGKQYLYIQQLSEEDFTIIDVTKPLRPNVVNRVNLANRDFREQLQMVGAGLAIAEAPDAGTSGSSNALVLAKAEGIVRSRTDGSPGRSPSQFVRLLDLSDPASPRTLQTFNAVSNILLDGGRNLIYITNGEGQWILSHNVAPPHRICDSEITDDANCYAY